MLGVERNRPSKVTNKVTNTNWYSIFAFVQEKRPATARQEEIKDQKQRRTFPITFYYVKPFKKQFFGVHKGPPHAGNAKQATVLNVRSLHMCLIPLHLSIPLGDYYIEYCYRMLGAERNRPSKVTNKVTNTNW